MHKQGYKNGNIVNMIGEDKVHLSKTQNLIFCANGRQLILLENKD